jgi:hypothetical protein
MKHLGVTVALLALVSIVGACRRKHETTTYASDTPPPAAAAPVGAPDNVAPPTGTAANPRSEPVSPAVVDRALLPDGGTLNGDPRGPRPVEYRAVVDAAMPALQACFDRASAELPFGEIPMTIHYTVEPPGYTGAVTAKGNAPQAVLDCCQSVVEELKFPQYRGTKIERDIAFTWFKRDPKARVASPDGGAAAAVTPK